MGLHPRSIGGSIDAETFFADLTLTIFGEPTEGSQLLISRPAWSDLAASIITLTEDQLVLETETQRVTLRPWKTGDLPMATWTAPEPPVGWTVESAEHL